jgi:hypothetical protein
VLSDLFPADVVALLEDRSHSHDLMDVDACARKLDEWGSRGVELRVLGFSRSGAPITAAVIGDGSRTLLAWGYPHPDEPLGTVALARLGDALISGRLRSLGGWRVVLVLCPDPDNVREQRWLTADPTLKEFVSGCWRPTHIGVEVDYGFPIDYPPFWQPEDYQGRCRTRTDCSLICGDSCCARARDVFGPLPESLALAQAIKEFAPDLVASMHSTHTGDDYTFLLNKETDQTLRDLTSVPTLIGTGRYLGEPIDRGRRMKSDSPDLIQERSLAWFIRNLKRSPFYNPEFEYHGNKSAAAFIGSLSSGTQFICPESSHFRHNAFADTTSLKHEIKALVSVEERPKAGRSRVLRIRAHDGAWVIAHQDRKPGASLSEQKPSMVPVTRGMLGVLAVHQRRKALAAADRIWERVQKLPDLKYHPYLDERAELSVPGRYVNDQALRIFRLREDYRRSPTVAQAASFNWLWPAHTASLMGNFRVFLAAQDQKLPQIRDAVDAVTAIQEAELSSLPDQLQRSSIPEAVSSMLARVLLLMLVER